MYSQPATTVARDFLRASFRDKQGKFDEFTIRRTGYFLHKAGQETGIEHRIVKNLLFCKYWKDHNAYVARPTWTQIVDVKNPQGKAARKPCVFSLSLVSTAVGSIFVELKRKTK